MSFAQRGLYVEMLAIQWMDGAVPDHAVILLVAEDDTRAVLGCFEQTPLGWVNSKLAELRLEAEVRSMKMRNAGKKGAKKRWPGGAREKPTTAVSKPKEDVLGRQDYDELRACSRFVEAWGRWLANCRSPGSKARKPNTGPRLAAIFNRALKDVPLYIEAIDLAIERDWQAPHPELVEKERGRGSASNREKGLEEWMRE